MRLARVWWTAVTCFSDRMARLSPEMVLMSNCVAAANNWTSPGSMLVSDANGSRDAETSSGQTCMPRGCASNALQVSGP